MMKLSPHASRLASIGRAHLVAAPAASVADTEVTLEELLAGWGVDLDEVTVETETLEPDLHVLRAAGGAVLASIGPDGVLIVDDQFARTSDRLEAAIRDLGGEAVDFVINTHAHFDHADANPVFGAAGAHIVAHENARDMLSRSSRLSYGDRYFVQRAYPPEGLPVVTFEDAVVLHFNGETIEARHYGPAHTDGDVVVHFREADVMHLGDLYTAPWPYLDSANGGTLSGLIAACRSILDSATDDTRLVSGHRPIASKADLRRYTERLETAHERLLTHARRGDSIEEVLRAAPLEDLDDSGADPTLFLSLAYPTVIDDLD